MTLLDLIGILRLKVDFELKPNTYYTFDCDSVCASLMLRSQDTEFCPRKKGLHHQTFNEYEFVAISLFSQLS